MSGEDRPFRKRNESRRSASSGKRYALDEWFTGKKEYEFGDLTRAFVRKADKALEWLSKKASEFVNAVESADTQRRIASETESGGNRVRERSQASGGHTPVSAATGPSSSASSSSDSDGRVDVELVRDRVPELSNWAPRGLLFLFAGMGFSHEQSVLLRPALQVARTSDERRVRRVRGTLSLQCPKKVDVKFRTSPFSSLVCLH